MTVGKARKPKSNAMCMCTHAYRLHQGLIAPGIPACAKCSCQAFESAPKLPKDSPEPTNVFEFELSLSAPGGPADSTVRHWLNLQHAGVWWAPPNVSKEHEESHWRLRMGRRFNMRCRVMSDGDWYPVAIQINGEWKDIK